MSTELPPDPLELRRWLIGPTEVQEWISRCSGNGQAAMDAFCELADDYTLLKQIQKACGGQFFRLIKQHADRVERLSK